jgi:DNA-binding transcriptional ArsR family regulator
MVEYAINLDTVFASLADATRRDILKRVIEKPRSISELAKPYKLTFAAVAKHVGVLETARLITKKRVGKEQIISAEPMTIAAATTYLEKFEKMWNARFDALDALLKDNK